MKQPKNAAISDISDRHAPADPHSTLRTPCLSDMPDDDFPSVNTQSATECTGLMPAMPDTAQQQAQLAGLMAIHCPPAATQAGQAAAQSAHAADGPSDAHNPRMNTPSSRQASKSAPNHRH